MAETFGKTTKGGTEVAFNPNYIFANKFTSGSAGELASMTAYYKNIGAASNTKLAIYDSSYNKLTNGETEEKNILNGTDNWITFDFPTSPTVLATTVYWLCQWIAGGTIKVYWTVGDFEQFLADAETYDGWPATLQSVGKTDKVYSIYATYEEAPPPAKKTLVQAALISIPPLIVLPTLGQIIKVTGGC